MDSWTVTAVEAFRMFTFSDISVVDDKTPKYVHLKLLLK